MNCLDLTWPSPAGNLACDEALLDACEAGGAETLRFWESASPFVVVGHGNHLSREVDLAACVRDGVPVLRRCSGGGTVLQGPGCMNYALILRIVPGPLESVTGANRHIMEQHRAVLAELTGQPIAVAGHSDLVMAAGASDEGLSQGRICKFSGNAQRRRRAALLFHGTFLLDFDLPLIPRYLRLPSQQPAYRAGRLHPEFVSNLTLDRGLLKSSLCKCWEALKPLLSVPNADIDKLIHEKYSRPEWHTKFP